VYLTQFTDYVVRVAFYLATRPDGLATVDQISRSYGLSRNHLAKVVQRMTDLGIVDSRRGRGGGLRLAKPPDEINLGWLVRQTEPHFHIAECFEPATNTCPIAPARGLKGALHLAREAFLGILDEYGLDQFLTRRSDLITLLDGTPSRRAGGAAGIVDMPEEFTNEQSELPRDGGHPIKM
jgi:Rrf2 family transcriptional regulator, nitric oxide-sensitive transcriptional repressor